MSRDLARRLAALEQRVDPIDLAPEAARHACAERIFERLGCIAERLQPDEASLSPEEGEPGECPEPSRWRGISALRGTSGRLSDRSAICWRSFSQPVPHD
ncbi:MAG: hypothetical protein KKE69_07910 [Alphaproteobacteria bacterium]|jgi:hypothetical protein|nr:hypothetical protein [Alphaproteobacteria bacterium]MBU1606875.1 hypothetical protein [Alphaproteobacteria bacterium]